MGDDLRQRTQFLGINRVGSMNNHTPHSLENCLHYGTLRKRFPWSDCVGCIYERKRFPWIDFVGCTYERKHFPGLTVWGVHKNGNIFLGLTVWNVHNKRKHLFGTDCVGCTYDQK